MPYKPCPECILTKNFYGTLTWDQVVQLCPPKYRVQLLNLIPKDSDARQGWRSVHEDFKSAGGSTPQPACDLHGGHGVKHEYQADERAAWYKKFSKAARRATRELGKLHQKGRVEKRRQPSASPSQATPVAGRKRPRRLR